VVFVRRLYHVQDRNCAAITYGDLLELGQPWNVLRSIDKGVVLGVEHLFETPDRAVVQIGGADVSSAGAAPVS
jgi:hypothetical protein